MQRTYRFRDGKKLTLGGRTLVMGILNVTPDSFSDGGRWNTRDSALRHMEEMVRDGADIIDIGAESSRPGFLKRFWQNVPCPFLWTRLRQRRHARL